VDNCANVATLGYYNAASSSWTLNSWSEIWLGDDEFPTGPLVVVGTSSHAAVHWLGFQATNTNTTSSPFVMNGYGSLTLYNPPGTFVASTPYPLVTKGSNDVLTVVGGTFYTNSAANQLGSMAQDSTGNRYFAETPLTEVPSGSLPPASLYTRFRCFGVASSSGADAIQCGYQSAPGTYAYTPNLATVLTSSTSSKQAVDALPLVTDVSNEGNTSLAVSGSCAGCGTSGSGFLVKDANGNEIGTLVGNPSGSALTIYKSGYFVSVNADGTFPSAHIWWASSSSCAGTPYLYDGNGGLGGIPNYAKTVVWSGSANSFYIPSGTNVNNVVTSVGAGAANPSIEKPDNEAGSYECDTNSYASSYGGWTLSEFNPSTTLGWTLTTCTVLANGVPQSESCLAGPLQLP
jgi:hypothetical protein